MKLVFRATCITLLFTVFIFTGCAKHAPTGKNVAPPPPPLTEVEMRQVVVAKVNDVDLTMDELVKMTNMIRAKKQAVSASVSEEDVRASALDQVVLRELALQEAARQNLRVPKRELDKALKRFVQLQGHDEGFEDFLKEQHLTVEEVRAQIEKTLLLRLIFNNEVISKISVTDDDLRREYEKEKDHLVEPEKVSVLDILIPEKEDKEAAMKKAEEILADIKSDKDKKPQISTKGAAFTIRYRDLDKSREAELYSAVRNLQEGEYSGMVMSDEGIHIMQLTKFIAERPKSFDEVKSELQRKLATEAQGIRIKEWEQELKKNAKIDIVPLSDVAEQEAKIRGQRAETGVREPDVKISEDKQDK